MKTISAKIAPRYSLIVIQDPEGGTVPDTISPPSIAATDSCIAVACLSEIDGETELILGDAHNVDPGERPAFEGRLKTPNLSVTLQTAEGRTILEMPVPHDETRIRVWTNDPNNPDQVIVGIDSWTS